MTNWVEHTAEDKNVAECYLFVPLVLTLNEGC